MIRLTLAASTVTVCFLAGCAPPGSKLDKATKDLGEVVEKAAQKAEEQSIAKDLQEVYFQYTSYHDAHGQGPASWDELIKFATEAKGNVAAIQRARDKGVQVTWGKKFASLPDGMTNTVFAQGGGGPTMMFDGSTQ
jgi:hypothetical protein